MEKKKMALCTSIPAKEMERIKTYCDVIVCGELKHGKGNVQEEELREECMGAELVVLGDHTCLGGKRHEVYWGCKGHPCYCGF